MKNIAYYKYDATSDVKLNIIVKYMENIPHPKESNLSTDLIYSQRFF